MRTRFAWLKLVQDIVCNAWHEQNRTFQLAAFCKPEVTTPAHSQLQKQVFASETPLNVLYSCCYILDSLDIA